MPYIVDVKTVFPSLYYEQDALLSELKKIWGDKFFNYDRILEIQKNTRVKGRHLVRPIEEYREINNWQIRQKIWLEESLKLLQNACTQIFEKNNVSPESIGIIFSNSITGFSVPSIDARLMNKFSFKKSVKRVPIFGLGCLAGAALINRAADYLKAYPDQMALVVSVELCSLTLRFSDTEMANIISSALFGDGAGALLMCGDNHPMAKKAIFKHLEGLSTFFPNTERVMGWDIASDGLQIVLNSNVAEVAEKELPILFSELSSGFAPQDLSFVLGHPGGPKVLESLQKLFPQYASTFKFSWESLEEKGNLSSVSIWNVMERFKNSHEFLKERKGHFFALGPGFCAEGGILQCLG